VNNILTIFDSTKSKKVIKSIKTTLILFLLLVSMRLLAQETKPTNTNPQGVLIFGFLNGGGALIGVDAELMIKDTKVALIGGMGYKAFGAGIAYHFKPTLNSSSINMNYWHQGLQESYFASYIGHTYAVKILDLFAVQVGIGKIIDKGPQYDSFLKSLGSNDVPFSILLSIGICRFGKSKDNESIKT